MIEVMEAFERGEEVEYKYIHGILPWVKGIPTWNWSVYDYRISEKPKNKVTYWRAWWKGKAGTIWSDYHWYPNKHEEESVNAFHHWESMEVEE